MIPILSLWLPRVISSNICLEGDVITMADHRHSWKNFKALVTKMEATRYLLVLAFVFTIIGALGNLGISVFIRYSVDAVFSGVSDEFVRLGSYFFVTVVIVTLATFGERFFVGKFAEKTIASLRQRAFVKLNRLPVDYLEQQHSGDLLSRLTNDINLVHEFLFHRLIPLIFNPLMAIIALIYLVMISWHLTLVVLALTPILSIGVSLVSKPMGKASSNLQHELGKANSLVQDSIAGNVEVKAFNLQHCLGERFIDQLKYVIAHGLKLAKQRSYLYAVANIAGFTPFLVCFGYGGYLAVNEIITLGAFLAFINLLNYISNPLTSMPQLIGHYHTAMAAYHRIEDLLKVSEERSDGQNYPIKTKDDYVVEFDNVSFSYGQSEVLTELSFKVKRGETLAVIGSSGSGKSTILRLITSFYQPQAGKINLFGHDLMDWNLNAVRARIALVSQDTYLYPTTIKENIAYGLADATDDEIVAAAKQAFAHQFIMELPQGYETLVGERGSRLSGGQKQRIAIARAILKNAELLLLDEPTSALDNKSEHVVQQALEQLMRDRTTIVVAHRLSTIKNADRVMEMEPQLDRRFSSAN